jgi:hypothetical protein
MNTPTKFNPVLIFVFVLMLAALAACAPATAVAPAAVTQPPDVSSYITNGCTAAAVSVFGAPNPVVPDRVKVCIDVLTRAIASNGGIWPKPGTTPMEIAKTVATDTWNAGSGAAIDRMMAALKQQRYALEDAGILIKDPTETRDDPQKVLDGPVLMPAAYPWKGTIADGGNLSYTLRDICIAYARNGDDCSGGSVLWHSQEGDVAIYGGSAFDYAGTATKLPVAQAGDTVLFGDQKTITGLVGNNTLVISTEGGYTEGFSCVVRISRPSAKLVRTHFNQATQAWEVIP